MSAELIVDVNLVKKTAMHNFSCKGLDSFVLNVDSNGFKTRLFITNNECDLRNTSFEHLAIPIHAHKYIDEFIPLDGLIFDYILEKNPLGPLSFRGFTYPRLNDNVPFLPTGNTERFKLVDAVIERHMIGAGQFHTVGIASGRASWIIKEVAINPLFEQVCYLSDNFNFKKRNLYLPYNGNAVTTVLKALKRVNNVIPQIGNNYAEGSNPLRRYG
ncbi:MAG: hypothetical protein KA802_11900 [Saprospiraceae bacterium]|nr:hypothetical protein [Saprospiraceae bacterium]